MAAIEFKPWPKTPRLYRQVTITEKIDGISCAVIVSDDGAVAAQNRRRIITPENDHHGFGSWVKENADYLHDTLGPGHHYGEWWGVGIQRGYGMSKRVFSLFNLRKWGDASFRNDQLRTVPVLYRGNFCDYLVDEALSDLDRNGSQAAPGYLRPEGVCVFHEDSNQVYKVTLANDGLPKTAVNNEVVDTADWFSTLTPVVRAA